MKKVVGTNSTRKADSPECNPDVEVGTTGASIRGYPKVSERITRHTVPSNRASACSTQERILWEDQALGAHDYVISAGEKTSIQARVRLHPTLPPQPKEAMRVEFDYERGGPAQEPSPVLGAAKAWFPPVAPSHHPIPLFRNPRLQRPDHASRGQAAISQLSIIWFRPNASIRTLRAPRGRAVCPAPGRPFTSIPAQSDTGIATVAVTNAISATPRLEGRVTRGRAGVQTVRSPGPRTRGCAENL